MEQTEQNNLNLIWMSFLLLAVSRAFLQKSTSLSSMYKSKILLLDFQHWSCYWNLSTCRFVLLSAALVCDLALTIKPFIHPGLFPFYLLQWRVRSSLLGLWYITVIWKVFFGAKRVNLFVLSYVFAYDCVCRFLYIFLYVCTLYVYSIWGNI